MDIYEALKEDHAKVKGLFEELEQTTERAEKKRESLFTTIHDELTLHTELEEKIFYPRFRDEEETRNLILEAAEEHLVVKKLLKELDAGDKGTEEWLAKATVMMENVRHHIKEEETELFKLCRKVMDQEEAEAMAEQAEEFKASKPQG